LKKILGLTIAVVLIIGLIAGGTFAYFSDTETVTGNSLTAGTIDLVAGAPIITITDIKPCLTTEWGFVRFRNVGDNPGNIWLHFANVMGLENGIGDSEADAYWANSSYNPDALRYDNSLECYTTIDVYYDTTFDGVRSGGTNIILESEGWGLAELEGQWIYLGEMDVNERFEVWVSFHIQDDAGNEFQSDQVVFDIEALLQQTNAPAPTPEYPDYNARVVRLENKANLTEPTSAAEMVGNEYWTPVIDGTYAVLTYDPKASTFNYTLEAFGLTPSASYDLIYYQDPWPGTSSMLIGTYVADVNGAINVTGQSVNLNMDLADAKIWLVLSADFTGSQMTGWNPSDYLFEMRLITYNDTDV